MSYTEKLLADYVWSQDSEWEFFREYLEQTHPTDYKNDFSILYEASKVLNKEEFFIKELWGYSQDLGKTKSFKICGDCFQTINGEGQNLEHFIFYLGEEEGERVYNNVKWGIRKINDSRFFFFKEVEELEEELSIESCQCCGNKTCGKRHYCVFLHIK